MNSKIKYIYLVVGLLVGIVIGGGAIWWIQNYDLKIWFSFSGKKDFPQKVNDITVDSSSVNTNSKTVTYNSVIKKGTTSKQDSIIKDSIGNITNTNIHNSDTTLYHHHDDDIVVVKDELIFTKNFKVEGVTDNNAKHDAMLDSLLIDDKSTKHLPINTIHVEFWKSPVNYKGYKYINNKLVLFGVYQYDFATFEYRNGSLFLTYLNNYYKIDKSDDFKQLLSVKKPVKLNKN